MKPFDYIYASFLKINGLLLASVSLFAGFLLWMFKASDNLPLWAALPLLVVGLIVLFVIYDALRNAIESKVTSISIRRAKLAQALPDGSRGLTLLIEPTEQLAIDAMITLYGLQDEFEIQLGVGYVETINDKRFVQAIVYEDPVNANNDIWEKILANDISILPTLRVKPSVPRSSLYNRSNWS